MSILRHQNNRLIIISKQNCQCWWIQFSIIIIIIIIKVMSHWITIEWRLQSLIWWCCIIFFFVLFYSFTIILNLDESRSEFRFFFSFIHPYCSVPTKMKSILLNLNITIINGSLLKSIQPKWFLCFMIHSLYPWNKNYLQLIQV